MKKLLLLNFLLLPATIWAQAIDRMPIRKVIVPSIRTPEEMERFLASGANPRVLELAAITDLYRQLSDTSAHRYVVRLRPGDYVVIKTVHPHWLAVCRAQSPTQFSADTSIYYIRKEVVKGSKTYIML